MSATPTLERQDTRLPLAIVLGSAVLVMGYLYFVDRKSTRLNSSHALTSYAVFRLKKKNKITPVTPHPRIQPAA